MLDDYRETIGMDLLRNGITDLNTGDPNQIAARTDLLDVAEQTGPLVNVDDYIDLPERPDLDLRGVVGRHDHRAVLRPQGIRHGDAPILVGRLRRP